MEAAGEKKLAKGERGRLMISDQLAIEEAAGGGVPTESDAVDAYVKNSPRIFNHSRRVSAFQRHAI